MIYIASPYTNPSDAVMEARFKIAEACTAFWMRQGLPVFSPIVHCRQISLLYDLPHDFGYWQKMNFGWINACANMWVLELPNWKMSTGVANEITHAENIRLAISSFSWNEIKNIIDIVPGYKLITEEAVKLLELHA